MPSSVVADRQRREPSALHAGLMENPMKSRKALQDAGCGTGAGGTATTFLFPHEVERRQAMRCRACNARNFPLHHVSTFKIRIFLCAHPLDVTELSAGCDGSALGRGCAAKDRKKLASPCGGALDTCARS